MPETVPAWILRIPATKRRRRWGRWWLRPWTVPVARRKAPWFKWALWRHGFLSPNFRRREARSGDGKHVPRWLRMEAQRHAFGLERVRHDLGDVPVTPVSWYRSGTFGLDNGYNADVGGARFSQHKLARATDWQDHGPKFDLAMSERFTGLGWQYSPRYVRHADNGPKRSWYYY